MNTALKWILGVAGIAVIAGALVFAGMFVGRAQAAWNPMASAGGYGFVSPAEMMGGGWGGHAGRMGGAFGHSGMMGGGYAAAFDAEVALSEDDALQLATNYLAAEYPQVTLVGDAFLRHGLYHWDLEKNGEFTGRVMVDGNNGEVFAHIWPASASDN